MTVEIERSEVGRRTRLLGRGAQAQVWLVPDLHLDDAPGPLVFKEYRPGQSPPHGLHTLVSLRSRLDATDRDRLDATAIWPLRVVLDDDAVCGVVLPLIPDSFLDERTLSGTGRVVHHPRELQFLFIDPVRSTRLGIPATSPEERLKICRDLASVLEFLHERSLVVGDLNAKNALYRGAGPTVMLVDCDAIRFRGSMAVVRQLNTADWDPPEGQVLSQPTDMYKFGLVVLRCLRPGNGASLYRDPRLAEPMLDEEGRRLLRATLSARPADRPTAREWRAHLDVARIPRQATAAAGRWRRPSTPVSRPGPAPDHTSTPPTPADTTGLVTRGWHRNRTTGQWEQS